MCRACGAGPGAMWNPGRVDTSATALKPVPAALPFDWALGVSRAEGADPILLLQGDADAVHPLASVSKPIAALGALVAVERGMVDLDEPAGPEGATVRHLLAHTAGYAFDSGDLIGAPGARRGYSNTGFEVLGRHLEEATGYEFADWMEEVVIGPLGLTTLEAEGSPAAGYRGSVRDLLAVGREWLAPTLVGEALHREAVHVQFPGLVGILPGYGRQKLNDWGLGVEIRAQKSPHWTGQRSAPETFGHFGQSGSFLWMDPTRGLCAAFLGTEPFGEMHKAAWPGITDAILAQADAA